MHDVRKPIENEKDIMIFVRKQNPISIHLHTALKFIPPNYPQRDTLHRINSGFSLWRDSEPWKSDSVKISALKWTFDAGELRRQKHFSLALSPNLCLSNRTFPWTLKGKKFFVAPAWKNDSKCSGIKIDERQKTFFLPPRGKWRAGNGSLIIDTGLRHRNGFGTSMYLSPRCIYHVSLVSHAMKEREKERKVMITKTEGRQKMIPWESNKKGGKQQSFFFTS